MNSTNPLLAQHYFYLCSDEAYFYTWTDWSAYGGFTSFYKMFCSRVLENQEFDGGQIYSIYLGFHRSPNITTKIGTYSLSIKKISPEECMAEAKQKAKEIRAINCEESKMMADKLDRLCYLLDPHKLKVPI